MIHQTIEKMLALKLQGCVDALREQQEQISAYQHLSFDERLAFLVDREFLKRSDAALLRRRTLARIRLNAQFENIDFSLDRNFSRSDMARFSQGTWLREHQNIIITGQTGVGKTFIASAIADAACRLQRQPLFIKLRDLITQLLTARADGSFPQMKRQFAKLNLFILDEWMRETLSHNHAREILDLIDDHSPHASFIFVSQIPVADWFQRFDDPTLADAVLDRIVHCSHRIELKGESARKRFALTQLTE
jgi:DNA replication protein DnaC